MSVQSLAEQSQVSLFEGYGWIKDLELCESLN